MNIIYSRQYSAPCCPLRLDFDDGDHLVAVHWQHQSMPWLMQVDGYWAEQFDAYFSGRLKSFDYPVSTQGTAFQQRVWRAIATIPYGEVVCYGDIARLIGSAPRAVGQACGKNPLPIIVPCHRVVAKQGLGGFGLGNNDSDLAIKRWLLAHEGVCSEYI